MIEAFLEYLLCLMLFIAMLFLIGSLIGFGICLFQTSKILLVGFIALLVAFTIVYFVWKRKK